MSERLSEQELIDIRLRAGDVRSMVDEILDWRQSMKNVIDPGCNDEKHCACVSFLRKRVETLEDAIRGAVDHPDLNGPDILEVAADMLEERTITLATQLRKTAKMQRESLKGVEDDSRETA